MAIPWQRVIYICRDNDIWKLKVANQKEMAFITYLYGYTRKYAYNQIHVSPPYNK